VLVLLPVEPGALFVAATFEVLLVRAVSVVVLVTLLPLPVLSLIKSHAPRPPTASTRIVATAVTATTDVVLRGTGAGETGFWNSLMVGRACCLAVAATLRGCAVASSSNERRVGAAPKSSISVGGGSALREAESSKKVSSEFKGASVSSGVPSSRQNLSVSSAYVRLHVGQRFILLRSFSADVRNPE
jgi:hypothetical protein